MGLLSHFSETIYSLRILPLLIRAKSYLYAKFFCITRILSFPGCFGALKIVHPSTNFLQYSRCCYQFLSWWHFLPSSLILKCMDYCCYSQITSKRVLNGS